jgi:hypothetical protein
VLTGILLSVFHGGGHAAEIFFLSVKKGLGLVALGFSWLLSCVAHPLTSTQLN